jgi:hypothetical protein
LGLFKGLRRNFRAAGGRGEAERAESRQDPPIADFNVFNGLRALTFDRRFAEGGGQERE